VVLVFDIIQNDAFRSDPSRCIGSKGCGSALLRPGVIEDQGQPIILSKKNTKIAFLISNGPFYNAEISKPKE
jgi:hypothetical protein